MTPDVDGFIGWAQPEPLRVTEFDVIPNKTTAFYRREPQPLEVEPEVKPGRWQPGGNQKPANLPESAARRVQGFGFAAVIAILAELKSLADTAASTERARRSKAKGCDCCSAVFSVVESQIKKIDADVKAKAMNTKVNQTRHYRNVSHRKFK